MENKKLKLVPKSNEQMRKEFEEMLIDFQKDPPPGWVEYWKTEYPKWLSNKQKQVQLRATNGDTTMAEKVSNE